MYDANSYKIIGVDKDGNELYRLDLREVDLTHQGEIMAISQPLTINELEANNCGENSAYNSAKESGHGYVCLSYEDASNIVDMLNEAIERLSKDTAHEDDDRAVFGDNAISYERLIDRLDGLCYPISIYKDKMKRQNKK